MVRSRNGVGAPFPAAGVGIIRIEEPADAELATGNPGHHLVFDDERGRRLAVPGAIVGDFGTPQQIARPPIDGDQVRVERAHVERLAQNGDPSIVATAADAEVVRQLVLISPEGAARGGVDRHDVARRLGNEHHAVDNQRCRLGAVELGNVVRPP